MVTGADSGGPRPAGWRMVQSRPVGPAGNGFSGSRRFLLSGVQIRDSRTLELCDHVLEHELALLEAPEHDLIHMGILYKPGDYLIQILVLYP